MDIQEHLEKNIKAFQSLIDQFTKELEVYDLTIRFYKDMIEDETKRVHLIPLLKDKLKEFEVQRKNKAESLDNFHFDLDLYKKELKQLKQ
tara:strand:- start:698 stop:967 length:270 start_codon:yes stop_codon:yes gene_type:complete